jgi:hypothetical protein
MNDPQQPGTGAPRQSLVVLHLLGTMTEVGLMIIIPLAIMITIGIKLDRMYATSPLFAGVGSLLAAAVSAILIARVVRKLNNL